jgi:hypothetical protein
MSFRQCRHVRLEVSSLEMAPLDLLRSQTKRDWYLLSERDRCPTRFVRSGEDEAEFTA